MNAVTLLDERTVYCPYCAEPLEVLIDAEEVGQQYIEDCQVCCKPISFAITVDSEGNVQAQVYDENETWMGG